jgi:choline dehydrogenase
MNGNSHDVIVVGGGTAGSVLAARLTERGGLRVLLIEAGSAAPLPDMAVPPAWPGLTRSAASWGDLTVPQGPAGSVTPLPRGRGLGGGSSINAMLFTRGHHSSYQRWADTGAKTWQFDDLLPYFKRIENAVDRDPALRGLGGPLTVGPAEPVNPVLAAALDAAIATGQRRANDISGGLEEGFGPVDLNIVGGHRQSAADAYLRPVRDRSNLTVVSDALVHRLVIENGRATGVEYSVGCRLDSASAAEIVVTAGAIGSAQLLMLSGVGPAEHLQEHGIEVVADLPGVGEGLQDHPIANVVYRSAQPVPTPRNNRAAVASYCHPVGALAMGDGQDTVVDLDLQLRGIEGVRIADASVMPAIPAGNTNATVYAIAERAAELVLDA